MRSSVGTYKGICSYKFLIQLLPLKSSVFVVHFSNAFWHGNEAFPKFSSQNEIVPLLVIFHLPYSNYRGIKICFTRVVIKIKMFHSCHTRVVCVALLSHSCHSCSTCVALVSLVSGTSVVNQTRFQSQICVFLSNVPSEEGRLQCQDGVYILMI